MKACTRDPEVIGWVVVSLTDEILKEQRREGIFAVLVVSTLGLLIAAWIAMRIGRSISRPLENLTATVDTMEAGNLSIYATEEGPMELRKLASGINQLSTSVRQYNVRMQSEVAQSYRSAADYLDRIGRCHGSAGSVSGTHES